MSIHEHERSFAAWVDSQRDSVKPEPPTQMNASKQKTLSERLDQIEQRNRACDMRSTDTAVEIAHEISDKLACYGRNSGPCGTVIAIAERAIEKTFAARSDVPALVKALRRALHTLSVISTVSNTNREHVWASGALIEIAQLLREPADSVRDGNENQPVAPVSQTTEHIRKDHALIAAHNEGLVGMPQGPCQCTICAPPPSLSHVKQMEREQTFSEAFHERFGPMEIGTGYGRDIEIYKRQQERTLEAAQFGRDWQFNRSPAISVESPDKEWTAKELIGFMRECHNHPSWKATIEDAELALHELQTVTAALSEHEAIDAAMASPDMPQISEDKGSA